MAKGDITRSTINSEQYAAPEMQKSGFDLSYSRHSSFLLGRLQIGGFQYVMPGDKISGSSKFNGTFNRIVTPMLTPVRAMSYQLFLPFRAVDRTFKKGMTPTKLNGMSASWSTPTITTKQLATDILDKLTVTSNSATSVTDFWDAVFQLVGNKVADQYTLADMISNFSLSPLNTILYDANDGVVSNIIASLTSGNFNAMAKPMYLEDALLDIADNITAKLGDLDHPISDSILVSDFLTTFLDVCLTPFIGRYSYYGELKYNYLRPWDFYRISHSIGVAPHSWANVLSAFDDTPQCEYALRIMYVIWYERFRNVDLEPVSSTLPDWNDFGSTSIFDLNNGGNLLYLIYRIRSWEKDMFTTAQIDDLSRHVYAPVSSSSSNVIGYHINSSNNNDTQAAGDPEVTGDLADGSGRKPVVYNLGYIDQLDGLSKSVACPVPSNVNDVLSALDVSFREVYGLDLNTLRQSQMLERYLKRNYLFGDEYQDRLLAHYNSRLSDMRINRPEMLGQAISDYDMSQEVSNVSTDETKVGDRTATATISLSGDGYSTFAEEFGMVITIYSLMPRPIYDGIAPQLLCTKQVDFPIPEFAANNEEFGRKMEIAASGLSSGLNGDSADDRFMFGRYPAYHAWRSRVDEVGGMFLDELQDSTFRRFWGMYSDETTPKLNYFFIHCRPNLSMFANTILYDSQVYGDIVNECFVERVLPTPVEVI